MKLKYLVHCNKLHSIFCEIYQQQESAVECCKICEIYVLIIKYHYILLSPKITHG